MRAEQCPAPVVRGQGDAAGPHPAASADGKAHKVRLSDVAQAAGVSLTTAWRTLRGDASVRASTRERVEAVAQAWRYSLPDRPATQDDPSRDGACMHGRRSQAMAAGDAAAVAGQAFALRTDALGVARMADVARLAGVYVSTVSRALSGSPTVRRSTRDRVLAAAQSLNYEVDVVARRLRTAGQPRSIAVILNGSRGQGGAVSTHDLVPLLACLSAELDDSGIDLLLLSCPAGAERALARGFLAGRFSAAVLLYRDRRLQLEMESCGAPYVLLSELVAPQASSAQEPAGQGAAGGLGDRVGPLPAGSAACDGFPARTMSASLLRKLFQG